MNAHLKLVAGTNITNSDVETAVADAAMAAEVVERIARSLGFELAKPLEIASDDIEVLRWVIMESRDAAARSKDIVDRFMDANH